MEYRLDDCSYYKKVMIGSKPIYIFDAHNMALPVWGTYASITGPANLVTFDTHTDTHCAFTNLMSESGSHSDYDYKKIILNPIVKARLSGMKYQIDSFSFEDVFKYAQGILNTEQILTGVAFGYLSSYTVRSHNEGYEQTDRMYGYNATYIGDEDTRKPEIKEPLFLDVDLDYFGTKDSIGNNFLQYVTPYFKAAAVITIAREPKYFEASKQERTFSVDDAERRILEVFRNIEEESNGVEL